MPNFFYMKRKDGAETWTALPKSARYHIETEERPMYFTVLAVSSLAEDLSHEEKLKLTYSGPLYFDWDSKDEELVIEKVNQFLDKLETMKVDLEMCRVFATGGKGYHLEIPPEVFIERVPKSGILYLPSVYREIAMALCVDTLDPTIYSSGRGRMWRTPNVQRTNGRYKVPISVKEMREMTPAVCHHLTSAPRPQIEIKSPALCVDLCILYTRSAQKVDALMKRRAKMTPDPQFREKAKCSSVMWAMDGFGVKASAGFQELATQLAIAAVAAGTAEDEFIAQCAGLISTHQSDSDRYGTQAKRIEELRRMWRYMNGNPCYEFSVGALKVLLNHSAPDLDGIKTSKEEVREIIDEAKVQEAEDAETRDEYDDVARGVTLTKHGIYVDSEGGKKRICSISFANACVLKSADSGQIVAYECEVMVNGTVQGHQTLELEVFSGLLAFNRWAAKYGHAFQGTDAQVRIAMMRFVQQAKRGGNVKYILKREGLDLVSIPDHENELLRKPFLVWSDGFGVITNAEIAETKVELMFSGFPDPRGVFRTDISRAPQLAEWIEGKGHKESLTECLRNLFTCQRPEMLGKVLGWYASCFWRQLFHKVYGQFPLLHVNGSAGAGKTSQLLAMASLFYNEADTKSTSPGSTVFAMTQYMSASSSIPLIVDEYKPAEMKGDMYGKITGMFRDSYNQRDIAKGGGSRENEDYRSLQFTQLSAPLCFIGEAAEEQAAVMERVVLATIVRPAPAVAVTWLNRFMAFRHHKNYLGMLGQHLAGRIVKTTTVESFKQDFDALYEKAKAQFLVTESDLKGGISEEALQEKQHAKERSVFNHTVAKFGLMKLRELVNQAVGTSLDGLMAEMEEGIYARMSDLRASTTPEYAKVLQIMSSMSYLDPNRMDALVPGTDYAFVTIGGRECIEIHVRGAYIKYRQYMRSASLPPLFNGDQAFAYNLRDSVAFIKQGTGEKVLMPGVTTFSVSDLTQLGVDMFKLR